MFACETQQATNETRQQTVAVNGITNVGGVTGQMRCTTNATVKMEPTNRMRQTKPQRRTGRPWWQYVRRRKKNVQKSATSASAKPNVNNNRPTNVKGMKPTVGGIMASTGLPEEAGNGGAVGN